MTEFFRDTLSPAQLIAPLLVVPGQNVCRPIPALPDQQHFSVDTIAQKAAALHALGIGAVALFGVPQQRDPAATGAFGRQGLVQSALRAIKQRAPALQLIADLCLCQYSSHGHCGVYQQGVLDNDATLLQLERLALELAAGGADMLMPSGMIDGAVGRIRRALDDGGFRQVRIISQAVKYASACYGPFRAAAHFASSPAEVSKESYQLDPANRREALREIDLDTAEGADIVMVKPTLGYGDVIQSAAHRTNLPVAAFSTSGEYGMIFAAAASSPRHRLALARELMLSCRRAGAQFMVTYFAEALTRAGAI